MKRRGVFGFEPASSQVLSILLKHYCLSQACWCTYILQTFGRLRQTTDDLESKSVSLVAAQAVSETQFQVNSYCLKQVCVCTRAAQLQIANVL